MEAGYNYFENRACTFYPCHEGMEKLNCLFCFCPMYPYEHCLGTPSYVVKDKKKRKDCSGCVYPHKAEHYEKIMEFLNAE